VAGAHARVPPFLDIPIDRDHGIDGRKISGLRLGTGDDGLEHVLPTDDPHNVVVDLDAVHDQLDVGAPGRMALRQARGLFATRRGYG
jgi:hypothetical protein